MIAAALICRPRAADRRRADDGARRDDPGADPRVDGTPARRRRHRDHLITHDMGVVADMADDVAVMYGGRMVESGPVEAIFAEAPAHPYTRLLLATIPRLDGVRKTQLKAIEGIVPAPVTGRRVALPYRAARSPIDACERSAAARIGRYDRPLQRLLAHRSRQRRSHDMSAPAGAFAISRFISRCAERSRRDDGEGGRWHFVRRRGRPHAGAGRRKRLRQIDDRLRDHRPRAGDGGHDSCSTDAISRICDEAASRALAGDMQIVFQDPSAALNPKMSIERQHRRADSAIAGRSARRAAHAGDRTARPRRAA